MAEMKRILCIQSNGRDNSFSNTSAASLDVTSMRYSNYEIPVGITRSVQSQSLPGQGQKMTHQSEHNIMFNRRYVANIDAGPRRYFRYNSKYVNKDSRKIAGSSIDGKRGNLTADDTSDDYLPPIESCRYSLLQIANSSHDHSANKTIESTQSDLNSLLDKSKEWTKQESLQNVNKNNDRRDDNLYDKVEWNDRVQAHLEPKKRQRSEF